MISPCNQSIDANLLADIVSVSKSTLLSWEKNGKITPVYNALGEKKYLLVQLADFAPIQAMLNSK